MKYLNSLNKCFKKLRSAFKHKPKKNWTMYEAVAQQVLQNNTGRHSYLGAYCTVASPHTTIGAFCSIADNVSIGTTHHPIHFLSTHPFCYYEPGKLLPHAKQVPFEYNTPCVIGNDVWIGKAVIIMDGVNCGGWGHYWVQCGSYQGCSPICGGGRGSGQGVKIPF